MSITHVQVQIQWHEEQIAYHQAEIQRLKADIARKNRGFQRGSVHGRKAGNFIRIDDDGLWLKIHVGKALWRSIGCPERMDVQRVGKQIVLWGVYEGDGGYAIVGGRTSAPKISCSRERDVLALDNGRYHATAHAVKIVIGEKMK